MSAPKFAKTVDLNQSEIVDALRSIGCYVEIIGKPCDLLVGYQSKYGRFNFLIEIKREGVKPRKDQQAQQDWIRDWPGQVRICSTAEEAVRLVTQSYSGGRSGK